MKVRVYYKNDMIKDVELNVNAIEFLIFQESLTEFCSNKENDGAERDVAVQMLLDMETESIEIIDIGSLS